MPPPGPFRPYCCQATMRLDRGRLCLGSCLLLTVVGCGEYPKDPEGTSERIHREGVRVGLAEDGSHVQINGDSSQGPAEGIEIVLLERMLADLGVEEAERQVGASDELMEKLERFELDIVVGGYTESSPWRNRVAFSRPWYVDPSDGDHHVLALPPGENRWLMTVDRWIATHPVDRGGER